MRMASRRSVIGSCLASRLLAAAPIGLFETAAAQTGSSRFRRTSVKIGNTSASTTFALQSLLKSQGILDEFGLDATHMNVSDGSKLIGSLLSGEIDVCVMTGIAQLLPAIEKGAEIKLVAGANDLTATVVYAKPTDIKTLADLQGRTVGTGAPGSLLHHLMVAAFVKAGVDYTKVKFVNVGSSADVFKALIAGVVDACPSTIDVYHQQERYGVHAISKLFEFLPNYPSQGAFASEAGIRDKRDAITRALAAYGKLFRFMVTPASEKPFVAAYQSVVGGDSASQGEDQWGFFHHYKSLVTDLKIPEQGVQFLQELNVKLGIQNAVMPFDAIADPSLARDAVALLG